MNALIEALRNLAGKVGDQAHLGKLITDFAPGLIVVLTLLAALDAFSALEVLPYLNREHYQERASIARVKLQRVREEVGEVRRRIVAAEVAVNGADEQQPEIDAMKARITELAAPKPADAAAQPSRSPAQKLEELEQRRAELTRKQQEQVRAAAARAVAKDSLVRLNKDLEAQLAREKEQAKALGEADQAAGKAVTLEENLERLGQHMASLMVLSLLIGAILAQISGKVFYNGLFYRFMKERGEKLPNDGRSITWHILYRNLRPSYGPHELTHESEMFYRGLLAYRQAQKAPSTKSDDALARSEERAEQAGLDGSDLVAYFRYVEIAMNSVIPLGLLALTVFAVATQSIARELTSLSLALLFAALVALVATPLLWERVNPRVRPGPPWAVGTLVSAALVVGALWPVSGVTWSLYALSGVVFVATVTMYFNARALYVGYFVKKAEAMLLVYEKLRTLEPATP